MLSVHQQSPLYTTNQDLNIWIANQGLALVDANTTEKTKTHQYTEKCRSVSLFTSLRKAVHCDNICFVEFAHHLNFLGLC